jgi:RecA-family ATPase
MQGRSRQIGKIEKLLRREIEQRKIDLIGLDPFVKLHAMEENDNTAMDFVRDLLVQLAIEYDIAVDAPHHTRRGALIPGDPDSGRGATGIPNAGRLVYTLTRMSAEEAERFGKSAIERHDYVRLDSAKVNIAPSSQEPHGSSSSA